jgi:hypothetical protein
MLFNKNVVDFASKIFEMFVFVLRCFAGKVMQILSKNACFGVKIKLPNSQKLPKFFPNNYLKNLI